MIEPLPPGPPGAQGGRGPLLRLLILLSRPAMLAEISAGVTGLTARVVAVRDGAGPSPSGQAVEGIPPSDWQAAGTAGVIIAETGADGVERWRITGRGRTEVKRRLSRMGGDRAPGPAPQSEAAAPLEPVRAEKPAASPRMNLDESPLAWLSRRRDRDGQLLISAEQFAAGERLRADFTFGQMSPRITVNWDVEVRGPAAGFGAGDMRDSVMAAQIRVSRALTAVGPELGGILIDVCCHLKGLEVTEKGAGWPLRSGKVVLALALTRLARHYGLLRDGPESGRGPVRHWGGDGYRPEIGPVAGE